MDTEEVIGEKEIIVSDVDKDAGMLYKSDKEKMFGYNTSVICNNNNYILTLDTNGSNVHDSVFFLWFIWKFKFTLWYFINKIFCWRRWISNITHM